MRICQFDLNLSRFHSLSTGQLACLLTFHNCRGVTRLFIYISLRLRRSHAHLARFPLCATHSATATKKSPQFALASVLNYPNDRFPCTGTVHCILFASLPLLIPFFVCFLRIFGEKQRGVCGNVLFLRNSAKNCATWAAEAADRAARPLQVLSLRGSGSPCHNRYKLFDYWRLNKY